MSNRQYFTVAPNADCSNLADRYGLFVKTENWKNTQRMTVLVVSLILRMPWKFLWQIFTNVKFNVLHFGRRILNIVVLRRKFGNKRHVTWITTRAAFTNCTFASYSVELFTRIQFINDSMFNTDMELSVLRLLTKF